MRKLLCILAFCSLFSSQLITSENANNFKKYKKEIKEILNTLSNNESLEGKKIYVHSWKKSSDHDTPPLDVQPWDKRKKGTWGSGDEFMFKPLVYDKLTSLGADVKIAVPNYLLAFFKECSPLKDVVYGFGVDDHGLLEKGYIPIEGRDLLDNFRDIEKFKRKTRYFSKSCANWVFKDVQDVRENCLKLLKKGIIPVLFNRISATLNKKFSQNLRGYKKYHYLLHRTIGYQDYLELLEKKPEAIRVYNVTFDDRNKKIEPSAADPAELYKDYNIKRGSFINDGILSAGVLTAFLEFENGQKISGQIMSVETGLICMGMELEGLHEDNKNINLLLTQIYNSRWTSSYFKKNGNLCWGPIELMVQKNFGSWSDVKNKIIKKWKKLADITKTNK